MEIVLISNGNVVQTWKVSCEKESDFPQSTYEGQHGLMTEIYDATLRVEQAEEKIKNKKWL